MAFVRPLDEHERQQLKRLARREVGRVSERIRMVLLSSRGYTVPQVAEIFECDEVTVRHWIARFNVNVGVIKSGWKRVRVYKRER